MGLSKKTVSGMVLQVPLAVVLEGLLLLVSQILYRSVFEVTWALHNRACASKRKQWLKDSNTVSKVFAFSTKQTRVPNTVQLHSCNTTTIIVCELLEITQQVLVKKIYTKMENLSGKMLLMKQIRPQLQPYTKNNLVGALLELTEIQLEWTKMNYWGGTTAR